MSFCSACFTVWWSVCFNSCPQLPGSAVDMMKSRKRFVKVNGKVNCAGFCIAVALIKCYSYVVYRLWLCLTIGEVSCNSSVGCGLSSWACTWFCCPGRWFGGQSKINNRCNYCVFHWNIQCRMESFSKWWPVCHKHCHVQEGGFVGFGKHVCLGLESELSLLEG